MKRGKEVMRGKKIVFIMIIMITMILGMSNVYADTKIMYNANYTEEVKELINAANKSIGLSEGLTKVEIATAKKKTEETKLVLLEQKEDVIVFYEDNYDAVNQKDAKKALKGFINALKDSNISTATQEDIINAIKNSNEDVKAVILPLIFENLDADLYGAYKILYPLLMILRIVFGVGTVGIIVLLIASTIMDLVYIGLPVWREEQAEKNGGKKPFGVSYEALFTVKEVEKDLGSDYKSAVLLYFKRRAAVYIVLFICILYLVLGEVSGLISKLLTLVSGTV